MSTEFDNSLLDAGPASKVSFATGAATYKDGFPGLRELQPRIYVQFRPADIVQDVLFLALLDTGAHDCILNEEAASSVQDHLVDSLGSMTLRGAYGTVSGDLYLLRVQLIAQVGADLDLEVVSFVSPDWTRPSFLGYAGALDRSRFAVAPEGNRFYFGRSS